MSVVCPCCRASNSTAMCRRCKADLSLLHQVEQQRAWHIEEAKRAMTEKKFPAAHQALQDAEQLRPGADLLSWQACLAAFQADFAKAWRMYQEYQSNEA